MDNPANDRYELQEFIDAGAIAGFVTTRICGTEQYGTGVSKMTVTKPVIVEPAMPVFANVGDDLQTTL